MSITEAYTPPSFADRRRLQHGRAGDRTLHSLLWPAVFGRQRYGRRGFAERAQAGHLPTGTRTRLVDGVLDLPQTTNSNRLEATIPLGDTESLDRLRERCDEVRARPAGASCLVDAALPADAGPPELDASTDRLD